MEKLKAKHEHKLTDVLKVLIFALFLLMPFLTFMPTALYYGFNEHAVNESRTQVNIQYKYETNEVNNFNDIVLDHVYHYDTFIYDSNFNRGNYDLLILKTDNFTINDYDSVDDIYVSHYDSNNFNYIRILVEPPDMFIFFTNETGYVSLASSDLYFELTNVDFIINDYIEDFINYNQDLPSSSTYNEIENVDIQEDVSQTISQQIYNSWQTMWQSPLYTWTNQSVLKAGLDNFTSVFGVSNSSYITNLLTYELIIVAIYIVIDIVITLFTWLTHLFNKE